MKTIAIPVVVGALQYSKGDGRKHQESIRESYCEIQKICMLGSARILRKVLSI